MNIKKVQVVLGSYLMRGYEYSVGELASRIRKDRWERRAQRGLTWFEKCFGMLIRYFDSIRRSDIEDALEDLCGWSRAEKRSCRPLNYLRFVHGVQEPRVLYKFTPLGHVWYRRAVRPIRLPVELPMADAA